MSDLYEKQRIHYARTYRHLKVNYMEAILFLTLFILPALIVLLLCYDELTHAMCTVIAGIVQKAGEGTPQILKGVFIPFLGEISYIGMPTKLPEYQLILSNLAVSLVLIYVLTISPQKGKPIGIYLMIQLLVHMMACIFFLLGREVFPYTLTVYSDLYVKQQVAIWITFLALIGLIMGVLGRGGIVRRVLAVLGVMCYSVLFGVVRYALFLLILAKFSILYIPLFFFALGPFFDFLYFVAIYAICTNSLMRTYDVKRKGDWMWA